MELDTQKIDAIVLSAYTDFHNCVNQIRLNKFSYLEYKDLGITIPSFEETNIDNDVEFLFLEYLDSTNDKLNFTNEETEIFISDKINILQSHFNKLITLITFFDLDVNKKGRIKYLTEDVEAVKMLLEEKRFKNNYSASIVQSSFIKRERKNNTETKILSSNATAKLFIAMENLKLINSKFYTEKARAINILTGYGIDNMEDNLANFEIKKDDIILLQNFTRDLLNQFQKFKIID